MSGYFSDPVSHNKPKVQFKLNSPTSFLSFSPLSRFRSCRGVSSRLLLLAEQDQVPPPPVREAAAARPLQELQGRDTLANGAGGTHSVKVKNHAKNN
jgi:hypothetical protein